MKSILSIMLLVVLVSPLATFAQDTTSSVSAEATVSTTNSEPREGGELLNKAKSKIKNKKQKRQKKQKVEALTLTTDQISCISSAMDTRDTAQKKAHTDGAVMINDAVTARNEDLKSSLSMTGEARLNARKEARNTFGDMSKKSREWEQKAVRMAQDAYITMVKNTCKVTSSDQLEAEVPVSVQSEISVKS